MIIRFSYSSSCFFLSRQAPMIIKKIFSGFLPVRAKKKIRSIREILGVASVSLRRRVGVQEQQE